MNDPFDIDADDFFGTDEDLSAYAREAFAEAYFRSPELLIQSGGDAQTAQYLKTLTRQPKKEFKEFFKTQDFWMVSQASRRLLLLGNRSIVTVKTSDYKQPMKSGFLTQKLN